MIDIKAYPKIRMNQSNQGILTTVIAKKRAKNKENYKKIVINKSVGI